MPESVIIDVREPEEFAASHVAGALNIPLSEIATRSTKLSGIDNAASIVVYCNSGSRSGQAKKLLESYGFSRVSNGINQPMVESKFN